MNNPADTFLQEAEDLLIEIEAAALAIGGENSSGDDIDRLFRAFHTIKGSGAMFGFDRVAAFTHHVETTLDLVRSGRVPLDPSLTPLLLAAKDHIGELLSGQGGSSDETAKLVETIQGYCSVAPDIQLPQVASACVEPVSEEAAGQEFTWNIEFKPAPDLFVCGGNPVALLRDLARLGPCEIRAHVEDIPCLDEIQFDQCYLSWTITLRTASDRDAIRDVFIFVEDGSRIDISRTDDSGVDISADISSSNQLATGTEDTPKPSVVQQPQAPAPPVSRKPQQKESSVRVAAAKLDRLVALVGELVTNQARLAQVASRLDSPELALPVEEIERLVAELRDDVLGIRMMQIGSIFGRFRRLVHDLSTELGKELDLTTEGEETELDKSILDQLAEPLVHLLRNSIDHGIEPADVRLSHGKPRRGTIKLRAEHTGSGVVVTIEDDGRGLNRDAIRARAVERGLISADATLSEKDLLSLILLPGFSTAAAITNVSGRGVGMDVVKKQIDALHGSLVLASQPGKGTKITLTLPLTLAIIEGLLVEIGTHQFIIPMTAVMENVELHRADRLRGNGRNIIPVRGVLVPYIDLRQSFELGGDIAETEKIVIVQHENQRVGLVVERVLGTHQTVIQSLGCFFRRMEVVSGSTVMGDGRVALILDIPAIIRFEDQQSQKALGRLSAA